MAARFVRFALKHRGAITVALVAVLLANLFVLPRVAPPSLGDSDLPVAARCQGGGPGCAEQPLIPPPVGGLPHFDPPADPAFGALIFVAPTLSAALHEAPPFLLERPPALTAV